MVLTYGAYRTRTLKACAEDDAFMTCCIGTVNRPETNALPVLTAHRHKG